MNKSLQINFFRATVESVLLYVAESWTLTGRMRDRLDGTYTEMIRTIPGVSWREKKTNKDLYRNLPKITDTLRIRRLKFIGHCWRRKNELIHKVLTWVPKHGKRKRGRPPVSDQIKSDTGMTLEELQNTMETIEINGEN